jgi:hypothetical protein
MGYKMEEEKKVEEFSLKDLKFSFDLSKANYEIDCLQNKLLQLYLRNDIKFRRAFSTNYTMEFLQFLRDKARLREPVHISVMGQTRSGKSFSSLSLAVFLMACYGKKFTIQYVCANAYEFLEKVQSMSEEDLLNTCFLLDESKQSVFGQGSTAKKLKLLDVQNIIAINNISTISLNPNSWANKESMYGLRSFGRDFVTKTCRFMLYNLSEHGSGNSTPMGNVYLPIFTAFLPKDYADQLEKDYLAKKKEWVRQEMSGGGQDVLAEMKRKSAESFCRDVKFQELKKKNEKLTYISVVLGSEWTTSEVQQIYEITKLIQNGILDRE